MAAHAAEVARLANELAEARSQQIADAERHKWEKRLADEMAERNALELQAAKQGLVEAEEEAEAARAAAREAAREAAAEAARGAGLEVVSEREEWCARVWI